MQVVKEKDKLIITFPYNVVLLAAVRMIPGRDFNKTKKHWSAPLTQIVTVYRILQPFGFVFDEACFELYKNAVILQKKVVRLKSGAFKDIEAQMIKDLELPLYMYQQIGAGFLAAIGSGLIGDQPGLGKTIQSLAATELKKTKKNLIFCPVSMKKTWQEEIEKWLPHKTSIIIGGDVKQRTKLWSKDVNYYICNYHLLLRDLKFMKDINWDFILADEATTISNSKAKTTKNLKKIKAKRRIAMTGTPLNNTLQDIWSIMDWTQPGILGTYWHFTEEYCLKDKHGAISGFKNLHKLAAMLDTFMLRRLKSDVLHELPPKVFENVYVEFSPEERKIYETIKEGTAEELKHIDMFDKKFLSDALVKMIRLKQATCSLELINGQETSSKVDALKELLSHILVDGQKTIIFTQFREMAVLLMRILAEYKPLLIAGGVSQEERDANRHAFNTDDVHQILIMTSAGAMGLNLQRASSVIHYDLPWSISALEQREDRAHRHGQKKSVTIYRMIVENSIDEYILKILHKKKKIADDVLGDNTKDTVKKVSLSRTDVKNILG